MQIPQIYQNNLFVLSEIPENSVRWKSLRNEVFAPEFEQCWGEHTQLRLANSKYRTNGLGLTFQTLADYKDTLDWTSGGG